MNKAIEDVLAERRRQVQIEGCTEAHDDQYKAGELQLAAASYAIAATPTECQGDDWLCEVMIEIWPWEAQFWKPSTPRRNLLKAAALLIAEIERIDRQAS